MKLSCFAATPLGLELISAAELTELGARNAITSHGGVTFDCSWDGLFRIQLRARTITRVLLRVADFSVRYFNELERRVANLPWSLYLTDDATVRVQASSHRSRILHTGKIAETVLSAIKRVDSDDAEQTIFVRMDNDRCTISIDLSGERLDRRGYRLESGKAPLRETIAVGLLRWSGWKPTAPLCVPMCGSGTWPIEAALIAQRTAANSDRSFPFSTWPCLPQARWLKAQSTAQGLHNNSEMPAILASDVNAAAIGITQRNAERAGVAACIDVQQADFRKLRPQEAHATGWILCNPPYGSRLNQQQGDIYQDLGLWQREHAAAWHCLVICPDWQAQRSLAGKPRANLAFSSGGKRLTALLFSPE